jgi:DNA sulfur modification protein DndB
MTPTLPSLDNHLVFDRELFKQLSMRSKQSIMVDIAPPLLQTYLDDGWIIEKEFKKKIKVSRTKPLDIAFEDEVWCMFANLGFKKLNKDRRLKLCYGDDERVTQQIDVLAIDDEAILVIECKATGGEPKKGNFKEDIEALGGKKEGLIRTLRKEFPHAKHKIKFIFATKNYYLSSPDQERLQNFGIDHFDYDTIQYYSELTKHLGLAARFQLLGNLFEGQIIPELDNSIPAIRGKMGGHTYYSFSIEPEKLLKIGYVLHRNKANRKLMPTYQRLIKKARLKSVQKFVDGGGFFPNSIIINFNSNRIRFENANTQVEDAISRVGVLTLPKTYRSAFIIDGQHRLYGYVNSKYKSTNTIPVVAFVNLDRAQQVKLFMQINENQKAVPKNLRNTLNADLLWDAPSIGDNIKALKLYIATDLGEDIDSPLFDRIIIGENQKTQKRTITMETIKQGLDRSNFFGSFAKSELKEPGTFWKGDNDKTYSILMPYLKGCFAYIKTNLNEEWNRDQQGNFLVINAGIESLIRIFNDIADHLLTNNISNPKTEKIDSFINEAIFYLDPLISYFKKIQPAERDALKKSYGAGQRAKYWRVLQKAIKESRKDFSPSGLEDFIKSEAKQFNTESYKMIRDVEMFMKQDFKEKLSAFYGTSWFKKGVPPNVYEDAGLRSMQKNREVEKEEEVEAWDCLNIIDYRKIVTYGSNWRDIFERHYTKPGEEKIRGGKEEKTKWMQKLERIRNQSAHSYTVKEEEFNFLTELYEWLINKSIENEYEVSDIDSND